MDFPEVRKFLLASYHDLPNILFIGALVIGSLLGYLPLVWLALGMILNGATTAVAQFLLNGLLSFKPIRMWDDAKKQIRLGEPAQKCLVGYHIGEASGNPIVAPSYWMSASAFFAIFSIYNSVWVNIRESKGVVDPVLVATRKAFSLSTLIIGIIFLFLVFARAFTGCETLLGGSLGVLLGAGVAIGFWHLLDACGTGKMPDILQVVGSMAPNQTATNTPVMCVPQSE